MDSFFVGLPIGILFFIRLILSLLRRLLISIFYNSTESWNIIFFLLISRVFRPIIDKLFLTRV